jgi:hypothetical protein
MSFRRLLVVLLALLGACTTVPVDPVTRWLAPGEVIQLRVVAQLQHGHDMTEPAYDPVDGYPPIPTYDGELLLTDSRLFFLAKGSDGEPSTVSMPYSEITRARPSKTPLLHYIVVWDADNHADSFLVSQRDVQELHRLFAVAWAKSRQQQKSGAQTHTLK